MTRSILDALRALSNEGDRAITLEEGLRLEDMGFAIIRSGICNDPPYENDFFFIVSENGIDHLGGEG